MPGKHSQELLEIKKLKELVELRNKEIKDIKVECATQFEKIKNLCFINDYNDKYLKLRKIHEIASDNFSALVKDIVISETDEETPKGNAKIIELPNTRKSNK
jgi:hypothetical protein